MRGLLPFAALALLALPIAIGAQQAGDSDGSWSSSGEGETRSLSLGGPAFVWIERLRRADAPVIGFAVTDAGGSTRPFESGLLEAGNYGFAPNGRFDAASAWRVAARPVIDGAGAGPARESALVLQPNQPVRLPPREAPTWIAVDLPGAGLAELQVLAGSAPAALRWLTAAGKAAGTGPRMAAYGPRRVFLALPPSPGETVVVRFEPNRDALEPNDEAPMAAAVVPGRWYRIVSRDGDTDWLELKLAAGALVSVSTRGLPAKEAPALLGPDGKPAGSPLALKKGTHRIALARGSVSAAEPYLMRIDAIPHTTAITFGEPVTLAASSLPSAYAFALRTGGARRIEAWPSGAPRDADIRWSIRSGDQELAGGYRHAVYLPAGSYTMNVQVPATADPRAFRFIVTEAKTDGEPNDRREEAAPLTLPATLAAAFGLPGDQDWYRLTVAKDGILRIRQPGDAVGDASDIALSLLPKGSDQPVTGFANSPGRLDTTFSVARGEYDLKLTRGRVSNAPVALEIALADPASGAEGVDRRLGIAMVGFGVKPGDGNWMETLARDKALKFIPADVEGDFGDRLAQSLDENIRAVEPGSSGWIFAAILVVLLAGGGAYLARRRGWRWRRA